MSGDFKGFAAGVALGQHLSGPPRGARAVRRAQGAPDGLSPSQRRRASTIAKIIGNVCAAVFFAYEIYVYLAVMR